MIPTIQARRIQLVLRKYKAAVILTFAVSSVLFVLLTGIAYFTHAVYVTDGENTKHYFTMLDDPYEILEEKEYSLGAHDEIECTEFMFSTATITIHRAFEVPVVVDEQRMEIPMAQGTVEDVLEKAEIELSEFDDISIPLSSPVTEDTIIEIDLAFDVTIEVDGRTETIATLGGTVAEVLDEAGIFLSADDRVSEDLDAQATDGMHIVINRVEIEREVTTEVVEYEVIKQYTGTMSSGETRVNVAGQNGERTVTTQKVYVDGELESEEVISSEITTEPVNEVVDIGTALSPIINTSKPDYVELDANGIPVSYSKVLTGKSTAYTASAGAKTASGRLATIGTVAVNPTIIPYGTELYIVSTDGRYVYGYAIAADTGTALMDGRVLVDVYMGDRANHYYDSVNWGAKTVNVYILD